MAMPTSIAVSLMIAVNGSQSRFDKIFRVPSWLYQNFLFLSPSPSPRPSMKGVHHPR